MVTPDPRLSACGIAGDAPVRLAHRARARGPFVDGGQIRSRVRAKVARRRSARDPRYRVRVLRLSPGFRRLLAERLAAASVRIHRVGNLLLGVDPERPVARAPALSRAVGSSVRMGSIGGCVAVARKNVISSRLLRTGLIHTRVRCARRGLPGIASCFHPRDPALLSHQGTSRPTSRNIVALATLSVGKLALSLVRSPGALVVLGEVAKARAVPGFISPRHHVVVLL